MCEIVPKYKACKLEITGALMVLSVLMPSKNRNNQACDSHPCYCNQTLIPQYIDVVLPRDTCWV